MAARDVNPIEGLLETLRAKLPGVELELDPAETDTGSWFLDARLEGQHVVVEWRPDRGFGVASSPEIGYGAGVDGVIVDEGAALERVVGLLVERQANHRFN